MKNLKSLSAIVVVSGCLFAWSCNSSTNNDKKNNSAQAPANDTLLIANSSTATNDNSAKESDATAQSGDTSAAPQNNPADSMLSQLKGITSMLGKNDSNLLKNMGGTNMDSMMKKLQSMMGGKSGNPGDAIGEQLLNLQLGQMSKDNPIKAVANSMMEAQQNGTAGPSKTYSAAYTTEQQSNYTIPISGDGSTIVLQYTGGSVANNKKDGLWKNIYVSTNTANKWNVFTEGYAEQSAINMKVHATSLASINETFTINTNDQYKKFNKQQRIDAGKNESNVQVQKIGAEKMFGYNCMHVKVTYTIKGLGQVAHEQDDEWYSNEVPGAQFLSPLIFENHSPAVVKKIIDADCSGALVKSVTSSIGSSQMIQLSRIVRKNMPDSVFKLPVNYQEDKNTALYGIQ